MHSTIRWEAKVWLIRTANRIITLGTGHQCTLDCQQRTRQEDDVPIIVELQSEGVKVFKDELLQHMLLKAESKPGQPLAN